MSLHRELHYQSLADESDPDDWRPDSALAFVVDERTDMVVVAERLAPGDAIPLHRHRIDEVVVYLAGEAEVRVGTETHDVRAGDIVLVPAGEPHGMRNTGGDVVEFRAAFPSARLDIEYLERNPAPGTEGQPPRPPFAIDLHTGAIEAL
ncbi:MAG: cupin domain-containing protein [Gaiellaceae bacterium]